MTDLVDHYRTLGVQPDASAELVRDRYRSLALQLHPDRVTDPSKRVAAAKRMAEVNEAWRILGDSGRRASYDLTLRSRLRDQPSVRAQPPVDERLHGRQGDSLSGVEVSSTAGCALSVVPVVVALVMFFGMLIATAVLGGGGEVPVRMAIGRCVDISATVQVVPCTVNTPVIVSRGVAGTTCPTAAVAVVLPWRTEQICVASSGNPAP